MYLIDFYITIKIVYILNVKGKFQERTNLYKLQYFIFITVSLTYSACNNPILCNFLAEGKCPSSDHYPSHWTPTDNPLFSISMYTKHYFNIL